MTFHLVDAGEEAFLDLALAVNYTARLFVNDVTAGLTDAQIDALTAASFTEASFAGYAAAALTGGSWTTTQDEPSTGVYAAQTYTRSSTGTPQTVYGVYYTLTAGGALRWFETFATPVVVENLGDAVVLTPRITLGDEQDTGASARGVVAQFFTVGTDNDGPFTVTTTSTDTVLNNVPLVAGRIYGIHFHSQITLSVADGAWNILLRRNGSSIDRFARVVNNSDAVGTFATLVTTIDAMVFYEPTVTSSTDDFDVQFEEVSGGATFQADGAGTAIRWFTVIDLGLAP